MGAYTVFLDVALGFGSPALGLVAGWTGLGSVFLTSALLVLCAAAIAAWLLRAVPHVSVPAAKRIGDHHEAFRHDTRIVVPARLRTGAG